MVARSTADKIEHINFSLLPSIRPSDDIFSFLLFYSYWVTSELPPHDIGLLWTENWTKMIFAKKILVKLRFFSQNYHRFKSIYIVDVTLSRSKYFFVVLFMNHQVIFFFNGVLLAEQEEGNVLLSTFIFWKSIWKSLCFWFFSFKDILYSRS